MAKERAFFALCLNHDIYVSPMDADISHEIAVCVRLAVLL